MPVRHSRDTWWHHHARTAGSLGLAAIAADPAASLASAGLTSIASAGLTAVGACNYTPLANTPPLHDQISSRLPGR